MKIIKMFILLNNRGLNLILIQIIIKTKINNFRRNLKIFYNCINENEYKWLLETS